jgi:hypothetical protein
MEAGYTGSLTLVRFVEGVGEKRVRERERERERMDEEILSFESTPLYQASQSLCHPFYSFTWGRHDKAAGQLSILTGDLHT